MTPNRSPLENKYAACIYGILLISAILPPLLAVKNIKISPDSMMYALVSQEIISGNGIGLPIIYDMNDNYVFNNGTIPFVLEPPLFPIALALFGGVTAQNLLAAQLLNAISHVVISIFTFLLMRKISNNVWIALLTGILVSISFPLLKLTHYILSDTLCIAATAAIIYFLALSRQCDQYHFNGNFIIASIFTGAAILTRAAGVAVIPVFFWGIIVLVKNKSIKLNSLSTALSTILPLIAAGALFIRTYIISGSVHGWIPPSPERSYLDAFTGTIKIMSLQFDLSERYIIPITLFAIISFFYIIVNTEARRELSKYSMSGLDLIVVFMISHTALVTYAMAKSQTVFELRYMSPLVPFLFIACILLIIIVWEMIRLKGFSRLSLCGIVLSLGIITFGNGYKTYMKSSEILSEDRGQYRILNSPTYNWIKENYDKNIIITSNRPFHLSFFGGYSTIRLPHRRFENYPIPDKMEVFLPNRMSKLGSRVLALFEEADEQYEGSYIATLFNKRVDDNNFVLIRKFPDGVVYNLKE